MKKVLSLILCLLLVVSLTVPVLATEDAWEFEMDVAEQAEETAPEIYYFSASGEELIIDEDNVYAIIGEDGVAVEKVVPYDEFYGAIDGEQATLVAPPTHATGMSLLGVILIVLLVLLLIGLLLLIVAAVVIVLIVVLVRKKKKNNAEEAPNTTSEEAPDTTSEE
ncbi:MAG: hypothetical protein IIX23_04090 [Oscillospiraceae bacterium]|nr:hypothetical protein [Oscillospiraceae bacterium]